MFIAIDLIKKFYYCDGIEQYDDYSLRLLLLCGDQFFCNHFPLMVLHKFNPIR